MQERSIGPVELEPVAVSRPWGGELLGPASPEGPIGELWLLSTLESHPTPVAGEPTALHKMIAKAPVAWLGEQLSEKYGGRLPLLIKLLNTAQPLSVQLHPDCECAKRLGLPGPKHEGWLVLPTSERGELLLGPARPMSPASLKMALEKGELAGGMARFCPNPYDYINVPPGTIHALLAGLLILEVQEPNDVTLRLYDWGRVGRELHVQEALTCAQLQPAQAPIPPKEDSGKWVERTGEDSPFALWGISLKKSSRLKEMPMVDAPLALFLVEGTALLSTIGYQRELAQGRITLVPAVLTRGDSVRVTATEDCRLVAIAPR